MHSHLLASVNSQCSVALRESYFGIWAETAEGWDRLEASVFNSCCIE